MGTSASIWHGGRSLWIADPACSEASIWEEEFGRGSEKGENLKFLLLLVDNDNICVLGFVWYWMMIIFLIDEEAWDIPFYSIFAVGIYCECNSQFPPSFNFAKSRQQPTINSSLVLTFLLGPFLINTIIFKNIFKSITFSSSIYIF